MERILMMVRRNFFRLPYYFFSLVWMCRKKSTTSDEKKYEMMRTICYHANRSGNVTVVAEGMEHLPEQSGYILFPNHQGLFDVLTMLPSHERPLRVVMKKEAEENFFLHLFLRMLNGQAMDRDDVRQSMKIIQTMAKEVSSGANYLIFAEGTRSKNGNHMQEMKGGSFKSATKAKCPIVPVAIVDSYQAFDTHSTKPLTVYVSYLPPLYYEEYQGMKTVDIASMVKTRIETKIAEIEAGKASQA